jgi:extracellular factor (EF) 3-hydroxypalmitic acid methyl ester biosynthesis protein
MREFIPAMDGDMAINCPKCGSEFDATPFQFGNRVRCHCGTEIEYPGTDLRGGRVAAVEKQDSEYLRRTAHIAGEQFVADLDHARRLTEAWKNEKLTDMLVEAALAGSLRQLSETGCWGEANRLPSSEFWRMAGPLLETGVLERHARLKPRGYAGDFQMLHWIETNYCCDHPLGRAFDRYFQRQAAPQAVRCRTYQTAASLVAHFLKSGDRDYRLASVGSGPANDVSQVLAGLPEDKRARLHVTLLDLDPEALDFSRRQMAILVRPDAIRCIRENLFRLPRNRNVDGILGNPDFLICSGLFDYLDDETAEAMLRLFWKVLAENGMLLVGNFAPHNPTRAYMEWIGNWYLNYRTRGDLERLASAAGMPQGSFHVGSEALGIDLFLTARR